MCNFGGEIKILYPRLKINPPGTRKEVKETHQLYGKVKMEGRRDVLEGE